VTPIFVRPVREPLEHDRLIRFLQTRYKRKFEVVAHAGDEQALSVRIGAVTLFPDLVLMEGKRLAGLVEVETAESTNNLEAMAQWTHFSRARVPFHLYVPVLAVDAARRLCEANQVAVAEIWTYRAVNDQFDLVRVLHDANAVKAGAKLGSKVAPILKPVVTAAPAPEPPPPPAPAVSSGKGKMPAPPPVVKGKAGPPAKPTTSAKPVPPAPVVSKRVPVPVASKNTPTPVVSKRAPAPVPVKKAAKPAPAKKTAKKAPKAPAKTKRK